MSKSVDYADIQQRVVDVVVDVLAIEGERPAMDCNIQADLNVSSIDIVGLFVALEVEFGGSITDEEAQKLVTIKDVVDYIYNTLSNE